VAERAKPEPFYTNTWWSLEVAIAWVATGHPPLCQKVANLVEARRSHPRGRFPTLTAWMLVQQGLSTLYEATPGAIYRKRFRKGWKPAAPGPHPLDRAIAETAKILRGSKQNVSRMNISTRRFAKGSRGEGKADGISARSWALANIVDDRKMGVILRDDEAHGAKTWRRIDVQSEPFRSKGLGADRGRPTISQREPKPSKFSAVVDIAFAHEYPTPIAILKTLVFRMPSRYCSPL
jgi:hypothetical protein